MANVIRGVSKAVYVLLNAQHERLFGYVPDEAGNANLIYFPSPPKAPVTKTFLTVGTERYAILTGEGGGEAVVEVILSYRTSMTEREWTEGGEEAAFDLSYAVARLAVTAGKMYFTIADAAVELFPPEGEATTLIGFDVVLTCRVASGVV